MIHAGKTPTVICESNHFRVVIDGETAAMVPALCQRSRCWERSGSADQISW
jgi:hypothetical protein